MSTTATPPRATLSEDWLATLIGLFIVLIIGSGLLGVGPQTITVSAATGKQTDKEALAMSGWQVSATLGGSKITLADAPTTLEAGSVYSFICRNDTLTLEINQLATSDALPRLAVNNECTAEVVLTYRTNPAIPWPLLNLAR